MLYHLSNLKQIFIDDKPTGGRRRSRLKDMWVTRTDVIPILMELRFIVNRRWTDRK